MFKLHELLERDTYQIAESSLNHLLLHKDANYPWFILVPKREDITEIFQLSSVDQQQLLQESSALSSVLVEVFGADKLNVAAIGNLCPQLHMHHVVRYKDDAAWPAPVWGKVEAIAYEGDLQKQRVESVREKLSEYFKFA